jgi:hypothetical protein
MCGEQSRHERDALMEMATAIASERPLPTVLRRLLVLVVELTHAGRGALISMDPDGRVRQMVLSGPSGRRPRRGPSTATAGVVTGLLGETTSTRMRDVTLTSSSLGFPAHELPVTSLVGGQIRVRDHCYGCIYAADKRDGTCFTDEDERLVVALAAQAGMALSDVRLTSAAALHAAWRGALTRVASAARTGGPVLGFLGEVACAARVMADADVALVIGPDEDQRLPTVLAADGDGATHLPGLWRSPSPRPRGTGRVITVPAHAGFDARRSLWVMRTAQRPKFDPAMFGLVDGFWEQAANMIDHVALRSAGDGPAVTAGGLARGLHDDVVQTLFGIGMEIQAAAIRVGEHDLATRLQGAASNLDWLIERLRHYDDTTAAFAGSGTA